MRTVHVTSAARYVPCSRSGNWHRFAGTRRSALCRNPVDLNTKFYLSWQDSPVYFSGFHGILTRG
jgi:hypothetical protein